MHRIERHVGLTGDRGQARDALGAAGGQRLIAASPPAMASA
jgi:hypothetical protein